MRLAIASGKGGTGKTTLAVNLALQAAETEEVLLMDLDVEEPNSGLFIQGELCEQQKLTRKVPVWDKASCSMCGKCPSWCRFNALLRLGEEILVLPELCHSCYACSELCISQALNMQGYPLGTLSYYQKDRLSFVEGRLEIGIEQASPLIAQVLDYASQGFPNCGLHIMDCPPGTSCAMISATKTADYVILVTEPTPFGLYDLSLAVDTIRHLNKSFGVVVNRYGAGNDDVLAYCRQEKIPILAKIPNLRHAAELYSRGEALYKDVPEVGTVTAKILACLREPS